MDGRMEERSLYARIKAREKVSLYKCIRRGSSSFSSISSKTGNKDVNEQAKQRHGMCVYVYVSEYVCVHIYTVIVGVPVDEGIMSEFKPSWHTRAHILKEEE